MIAQPLWRVALARLALTLPLCGVSVTAVTAPLPGGFAHSGWYQFEVVVLVDTRAETLESETWPLVPAVTYPARWRWLQITQGSPTLPISIQTASLQIAPPVT